MIEGVVIKPLVVHDDIPDRDDDTDKGGKLMEVVRDDEGLLKQFGQATFTITHPGTIKAFHFHEKQDDLWFIASGKAMVVLHDMRDGSPTKGTTDVIMAGEGDYKLIVIPVGVAHGLKVVSDTPVLQLYLTTESYDAQHPDEIRIPHDDPRIGFDWSRTA